MSEIKFITDKGLKSPKKAAEHKIDGFLDLVFFKEEVLKKYESDKNFRVGDNGTVMFGDKWGTFRRVFRIAKGYIGAHLGDLGEGFPEEELKHWKIYNVNPSIIPVKDRYFDFRETIRRMLHFMKLSNQRIESHIEKFFFDIKIQDKRLFILDDVESVLNHIKKIINKNTTIDEFQSRIIFLNILIIETINTNLINTIFKKVDENLCYSYQHLGVKEIKAAYLQSSIPNELKSCLNSVIVPLSSLELLRKFILFLKVNYDVTVSSKVNNLRDLKNKKNKIYLKIKQEFTSYYRYKIYETDFPNKAYFKQNDDKIQEETEFLKLLNKFRNKTSAHRFNQKEYEKILEKLRIDKKEDDYSIIYEALITKVSYDIEHIYFSLLCPDPPIKEYYAKYIRESIKELNNEKNSYQSVFEELKSYLDDFPEFYPKIIKKIKRIYTTKKNDSNFIVELGSFIESLSYIIKDKSQRLVNLLINGLEYEKALTIAHFAHIIKNSESISPSFLKTILPIVYEGVKDKKTFNVNLSSEHVIFCLIEKDPNLLNKKKIKKLFDKEERHFKLIKEYLES